MSYLLLLFSILFSVGKVVLLKEIAQTSDSPKKTARINALLFFIASVVLFIFSLSENKEGFFISPFSAIISVFLSATLVFSQLLEIKAMENGSATLTSFIYSLGFLVPIVFGYFIWNEPVSFIQIIGVLILIFALFLILNPKKTSKIQIKWILISFSAMFLSGISAVLQKLHQYSDFTFETKSFLSITLLLASIYSFCVSKSKSNEKIHLKKHWKIIIAGGFLLALLNFVNTVLTGRLPATIQFPIYHIGSLVLTSIISVCFFNEKYDKKQIAGLILGVLSIIVIGIF